MPQRLHIDSEKLRRYLVGELPGFSCGAGLLEVHKFK